MVKSINVTIDDELFDRARAVKKEHNWTWEEFVEQATSEFEE